ncbi:MAG: sugar phosphate isomerase/epimerase [Sulfolobus sp.]|nr:sugar phosphate isomerase/epimerase [Sulfolobus sp.]
MAYYICINGWAYPSSINLKDALNHAKFIGFECFETNLEEEDLKLSDEEFKKKWKDIKKYVDDIGIHTRTVCTGLYWRYNPIVNLEEGLNVAKKHLLMASILEAKVILLVPGVAIPELSYDENIYKAKQFVEKVGKMGEDYGVNIGVENVWNRMLVSPVEMKSFIESINMKNVGVYFDIGNMSMVTHPEHWIKILGNLILAIHAKDFNTRSLSFGIPLTGTVNWKGVRKALDEIHYSGTITAEISPYVGDPYKAVLDTFNALKQIFG